VTAPRARSVFDRSLLAITVPILSTVSLAAFDAVAVIAALPEITADLGRVDAVSWIVTSFLLTSAVATLAAGPLVDTFGLRATFRVTVLVFLAASVACALATDMWLLVVFRAAQGVGGGLVVAVSLSAVALLYPTHLRSRGYAANSVVWGGMAVGGPAIAALLVATVGWRGVFLVNVPLCAAALVIGWRRFGDEGYEPPSRERFDVRGLALVAVFTTATLLGLSQLDARTAVGLAVAAVAGAIYWLHAGRVRAPVLGRHFLASMPYLGLNVACASAFGAALGVNSYLPVFVQAGLGHSKTIAALSVLFLSVGWTTASIVTSRMLDTRPESSLLLGSFVLVIPGLALAGLLFTSSASLVVVAVLPVVVGVGIGANSTSGLTLLQAVTPPTEVGRATAAHQYLRAIAFTYGAALVATVMFVVVRDRVDDTELVRDLLAGEEVAASGAVRDAVASGYRLGHVAAVALASLGLVAAAALRRHLAAARAARTTRVVHAAPADTAGTGARAPDAAAATPGD
jgi:MFS family permease